ncbi:MAG TPA: hypothetical protein VK140_05250 [Ktedonobacteraceae bacterium]|nr:hypothetical protein [Ktedonobacteraceae bacterium]
MTTPLPQGGSFYGLSPMACRPIPVSFSFIHTGGRYSQTRVSNGTIGNTLVLLPRRAI